MTKEQIEEAAALLYQRNVPVGPKWAQLGDVTRSVWIERVGRDSSTENRASQMRTHPNSLS